MGQTVILLLETSQQEKMVFSLWEKKKNPLDLNHKGCWTLDCLISEGEGQLMKVEPFPSLSGCPQLSPGGHVRLIGKAHQVIVGHQLFIQQMLLEPLSHTGLVLEEGG